MYVSDLIRPGGLFGGGAVPPTPKPRIAIHVTDMQTFALCRRQWHWSSTLRCGLQPAILPEPLFMGQGIHIGLEAGYRGSLETGVLKFDHEAAHDAFTRWVGSHQSKIEAYTGPLWQEERSRIEDNITMGLAMLAHYSRWCAKLDERFRLLGTEHRFNIPIPGTSLDYGGRFDGLIQDRTNDLIYVLEFKTSKYISESKLAGVFRSIQATAYIWAAHEVYKQPVVGVLYRILRKKTPDIPRLKMDGTFSYAKTQSVTPEWIDFCLDAMARQTSEDSGGAISHAESLADLESAADRLYHMARSTPNEFFIQKVMARSKRQLREVLDTLKVIGGEMADPRTPCPPLSGFHCSWCKFKDPCDLLNMDLLDACDDLLEAAYAPRDYWDRWEPQDD